jgi:hypothetical protein
MQVLGLIQLEFALGKNKIWVTMAILPSARKPHKPKLFEQVRDVMRTTQPC